LLAGPKRLTFPGPNRPGAKEPAADAPGNFRRSFDLRFNFADLRPEDLS